MSCKANSCHYSLCCAKYCFLKETATRFGRGYFFRETSVCTSSQILHNLLLLSLSDHVGLGHILTPHYPFVPATSWLWHKGNGRAYPRKQLQPSPTDTLFGVLRKPEPISYPGKMLLVQRHSPQEQIYWSVRKILFDSSMDGRFQPKVIISWSSSQKMRKTSSLIKTTSAIVRVRLHTVGSKSNFSSASFYSGWATGQLGLWGTKLKDLQSGLTIGECSLWGLIIQEISAGKKALWP